MKLCKKLKGIISLSIYNNNEFTALIFALDSLMHNELPQPIPVITNLFKGTDYDEATVLHVEKGSENRITIDNATRRLTLRFSEKELGTVKSILEGMVYNRHNEFEINICKIMILKKEYILAGFDLQYKKYMRLSKTNAAGKMQNLRRDGRVQYLMSKSRLIEAKYYLEAQQDGLKKDYLNEEAI